MPEYEIVVEIPDGELCDTCPYMVYEGNFMWTTCGLLKKDDRDLDSETGHNVKKHRDCPSVRIKRGKFDNMTKDEIRKYAKNYILKRETGGTADERH